MKVADLMITDLAVVNEDITMAEAMVQLADARVHGVPVVNRRGRIVGVLSSSDILQTAAEGASAGEGYARFGQTLVRDIMTPRPQTISPNADVKNAAQRMLEENVHRLFVVKGSELVGVISHSDIVRAVATGKL
ncbi:MAG: CBS domain-containing protein [Gemmatimonadales bacterium]|nr:CBS domain-containing protein [Gemmatimonadales bacterium]NIN11050.1 CBS domain-containing protein [Gemmatimonadales bacterium]NIN49647.1 CBS domain-containing protein [Gemmatimonadales bacterium]NIP07111.1 CBS domain-containing protein [Gemmatimonadales bacterium]NIQ99502.1 CBS domain-containing protein [Gemmatimonadales bacterium]